MNRKILFRGKRKDSVEWVYDAYSPDISQNRGFIVNVVGGDNQDQIVWTAEINPSTVGQYTGLADKKGKKIFEGDIVKTQYGRPCIVKYRCTSAICGYDLNPINCSGKAPYESTIFANYNLEIIGNIFDNPELLSEE